MSEISELRGDVARLREDVFRVIDRERDKTFVLVQDAKAHAKGNLTQAAADIDDRINKLDGFVVGDGNGRKGLIRRMDMLEKDILKELEALRHQRLEPSDASLRRGRFALSPQTIQLIVVGILAALGAGVSTAGSQVLIAPGEHVVQQQAAALAARDVELKRREQRLKWQEARAAEGVKTE